MKKTLLVPFLCFFFLSCSVEELEPENPIVSLDAHARSACADDLFVQVCSDEINNPTVSGFRNFLRAQLMLHTSLPTDGNFNPTPAELLAQYQQSGGSGIFATNYTVQTQDCGEVTIEITAEVITTRTANAGEISDISGICTYGSPIALDESLLSADALRGGKFTAAPGVIDSQGVFNPSVGAGDYVITYTVDESMKCVDGEDSTSFVISVKQARAYNDVSVQLCSSAITNPTLQGLTNYYKNLVFLNTDQKTITGTFSPNMAELLNQFNESGGLGTFTTNYTFNTECGPVTIELAAQVSVCN